MKIQHKNTSLSRIGCTIITIMLIIITSGFPARSQDKPKVPEKLKPFFQIAGSFEGEASGTFGGQAFKSKITHKNSKAADGFALYSEETSDMGPMGMYYSVGIFGYDSGSDLIHFYSVSNFNDVHDHFGNWTDDKTFVLQHSGMKEGKPFAEQLVCTIVNSNEYKFTVHEYSAGIETFMMKADMKRKK